MNKVQKYIAHNQFTCLFENPYLYRIADMILFIDEGKDKLAIMPDNIVLVYNPTFKWRVYKLV
jgi:hypothetical protein